ncbi:MAG TPA: HAMP domain-containing histidine kinase [Candidatus Butyricicoccus avistercoris]|uniref:histidine kinase n=1 Tax=Candidatus Butyricicoccus avistercoris TaxID=2838518 RepID=A0A9D1THI8_9FIRM|nr:HAMP domain-containing histidine kinase [Candidatus Butyricicoccus avistercoris]
MAIMKYRLTPIKPPPKKTPPQKEIRVQHAPGGLKGRWLVNSLSFVVVILAVIIIFVSVGISSYYYSSIRDNLKNRVHSTVSSIRDNFTSTYDQYLSGIRQYALSYEDKDKVELQFIDTSGRIILSTSELTADSVPSTDDADRALWENRVCSWSGDDPMTGERIMSLSEPIFSSRGELIGAVRMISSLETAEKQITIVILASIAACFLFLLLVIASNSYFIRSILIPVTRINEVAKEIAAGQYGMRLHKTYDDEIGQLCDSINNMSDEIAKAERIKNEFISSVSHELRTPLTAIAGWSETLTSMGAQNPEDVMLGLDIIQKESRRLTQMVEELLDFARMESGRMTLNIEIFDLSRELYEAVYMYENLLQSSGMTLHYKKEPDSYIVSGDRHRMKQVFLNIIDNAAKYGMSGGKIEISLYRQENTIVICVRDWGNGIPEAELPFVKEKFYKGSSKQRGSGIGLAVTDEIVRMHNGSLDITSRVGAGTAVYIKIPALDPEIEPEIVTEEEN